MFILVRLTQHVSSIIMLIVRRTDSTKNCVCWMPCCVGCSRVDLGQELCALFERWYATHIRLVYYLSNSAHSSFPNSTRLQPTQQGIHHTQFFV